MAQSELGVLGGADIGDGVTGTDALGGVASGNPGACHLCFLFNFEVSVVNGSCTECTGINATECVSATCAPGFVPGTYNQTFASCTEESQLVKEQTVVAAQEA